MLDINKVLQTIGGVLLAICLGLAAWGLSTSASNSERIARLEAERAQMLDRLTRIETKLDRLLEK